MKLALPEKMLYTISLYIVDRTITCIVYKYLHCHHSVPWYHCHSHLPTRITMLMPWKLTHIILNIYKFVPCTEIYVLYHLEIINIFQIQKYSQGYKIMFHFLSEHMVFVYKHCLGKMFVNKHAWNKYSKLDHFAESENVLYANFDLINTKLIGGL